MVQPIKWAGFGTGMMAGMGYPELQALGGQVVAIGAKNGDEVIAFLERGDIGPYLTHVAKIGSVDDIIQQIGNDPTIVDNVYVATIPTVHQQHALAVIKAGKDLLLEKGGVGGIDGLAEIVGKSVMEAGIAFDLNSQYRHHHLLDVSLRSLITGEDIDSSLMEKCGPVGLGKVLEVEIEYPQGYQEDPKGPLGWKARVDLAGRGKNVSDLGVHMIMTLLDIFDANFESFEGQTYNVHPTRWNPAASGQTFTTDSADDADLIEMNMLDSATFNGDDVSVASYVLRTQDGKLIPGTMYTTQVEGHESVRKAKFLDEGDKGNYGLLNGPDVRIKFENGYVLFREKQPNALEITDLDGGNHRVYERNTNPGPLTAPFQHPDGIRIAMRRGVAKLLEARRGGPGAIKVYSQRNADMMVNAAQAVQAWLQPELQPMAEYQAPQMPR